MQKQLYFIFLLLLVAIAAKKRQKKHKGLFCSVKNCSLEFAECYDSYSCLIILNFCSNNNQDQGLQSKNEYIKCLKKDSDAFAFGDCYSKNCSDLTLHLKNEHRRTSFHRVVNIIHQFKKGIILK